MLNNLSPCKGSRDHRVKRVGRGFSSGIGGRSTRGTKGQNARKSGNVRLGFEGGQMPLYRKVGKYGFNNYEFRKNIKAINIRIFDRYKDIKKFDREVLLSMGILKKQDKYIKLIGDKTIIENAVFMVDYCSTKAAKTLETNGNKVTLSGQGK